MQVHVTIHLEIDERAAKLPLLQMLDLVENKASDAFRHIEGITLGTLMVADIPAPEPEPVP